METKNDRSDFYQYDEMDSSQSSENYSNESFSDIIENKLPELFQQNSLIRSKYTAIKKIGSGGFGVVFKAKETRDDRQCALKVIPMIDKNETEMREVHILNILNPNRNRHPGVVRYMRDFILPISYKWSPPSSNASSSSGSIVFEQRDCSRSDSDSCHDSSFHGYGGRVSFNKVLVIQTELCSDTLKNYLSKEYDRDPYEVLRIIRELLSGLQFIHSNKVLHRDIKPENIFLDQKAKIKIGDFGEAREITMESDSIISTHKLTKDVGTEIYKAPEVKTGQYGKTADVYSFGIVIFELLYHMKTDLERYKVVNEMRDTGSVPKNFNTQCVIKTINSEKIMKKLVSKKPEERDLLEVQKWIRRAEESLQIKISKNIQSHQYESNKDLKEKMQECVLISTEPDNKGDNSTQGDDKGVGLITPTTDYKGDNAESFMSNKATFHRERANFDSNLWPKHQIQSSQSGGQGNTVADSQPILVPFKPNLSLCQSTLREDDSSKSTENDDQLDILNFSELGASDRLFPHL